MAGGQGGQLPTRLWQNRRRRRAASLKNRVKPMSGVIMLLCNRMFCCIFGWFFWAQLLVWALFRFGSTSGLDHLPVQSRSGPKRKVGPQNVGPKKCRPQKAGQKKWPPKRGPPKKWAPKKVGPPKSGPPKKWAPKKVRPKKWAQKKWAQTGSGS